MQLLPPAPEGKPCLLHHETCEGAFAECDAIGPFRQRTTVGGIFGQRSRKITKLRRKFVMNEQKFHVPQQLGRKIRRIRPVREMGRTRRPFYATNGGHPAMRSPLSYFQADFSLLAASTSGLTARPVQWEGRCASNEVSAEGPGAHAAYLPSAS